MKDKILKLRNEGKSYQEISSILNCAKSTVCYHCGVNQKEKSAERKKKNKKLIKVQLYSRFDKFLRNKLRNYKRGRPNEVTRDTNKYEEFYKKIIENPKCYITGDIINLEDTNSYELDHIIPYSKGGKCDLENMGLTIKYANRAKSDLYLEELIELCKKILNNNGYKIINND